MGPQAKIAVLSFALSEIERGGASFARDTARRALAFVAPDAPASGPSTDELLRRMEAKARAALTPGGVKT